MNPTTLKVQVWEPKISPVYHAVLWTGNAVDLVGMPDFNTLVALIDVIEDNGTLYISLDDTGKCKVPVGQFYIVHSTSAGFYLCAKKTFEDAFQLAPVAYESLTEGGVHWPS